MTIIHVDHEPGLFTIWLVDLRLGKAELVEEVDYQWGDDESEWAAEQWTDLEAQSLRGKYRGEVEWIDRA